MSPKPKHAKPAEPETSEPTSEPTSEQEPTSVQEAPGPEGVSEEELYAEAGEAPKPPEEPE